MGVEEVAEEGSEDGSRVRVRLIIEGRGGRRNEEVEEVPERES